MSEASHVWQYAEPPAPTFKAKVGRDAQGRVSWEVTVEGHTAAGDLAMALANAVAAVRAEATIAAATDGERDV